MIKHSKYAFGMTLGLFLTLAYHGYCNHHHDTPSKAWRLLEENLKKNDQKASVPLRCTQSFNETTKKLHHEKTFFLPPLLSNQSTIEDKSPENHKLHYSSKPQASTLTVTLYDDFKNEFTLEPMGMSGSFYHFRLRIKDLRNRQEYQTFYCVSHAKINDLRRQQRAYRRKNT